MQRLHFAGHQMVEPGRHAQNPAREAGRRAAALAAGQRERAMGELSERGIGGQRGEDREQDEAAKSASVQGRSHGQAMMARLAILKPKLDPGANPLKKDSLSLAVSSAAKGFGLATDSEQPTGALSSMMASLSSNSKSMKNSGSATSSEKNLPGGVGS